jgi:hypothetical protein
MRTARQAALAAAGRSGSASASARPSAGGGLDLVPRMGSRALLSARRPGVVVARGASLLRSDSSMRSRGEGGEDAPRAAAPPNGPSSLAGGWEGSFRSFSPAAETKDGGAEPLAPAAAAAQPDTPGLAATGGDLSLRGGVPAESPSPWNAEALEAPFGPLPYHRPMPLGSEASLTSGPGGSTTASAVDPARRLTPASASSSVVLSLGMYAHTNTSATSTAVLSPPRRAHAAQPGRAQQPSFIGTALAEKEEEEEEEDTAEANATSAPRACASAQPAQPARPRARAHARRASALAPEAAALGLPPPASAARRRSVVLPAAPIGTTLHTGRKQGSSRTGRPGSSGPTPPGTTTGESCGRSLVRLRSARRASVVLAASDGLSRGGAGEGEDDDEDSAEALLTMVRMPSRARRGFAAEEAAVLLAAAEAREGDDGDGGSGGGRRPISGSEGEHSGGGDGAEWLARKLGRVPSARAARPHTAPRSPPLRPNTAVEAPSVAAAGPLDVAPRAMSLSRLRMMSVVGPSPDARAGAAGGPHTVLPSVEVDTWNTGRSQSCTMTANPLHRAAMQHTCARAAQRTPPATRAARDALSSLPSRNDADANAVTLAPRASLKARLAHLVTAPVRGAAAAMRLRQPGDGGRARTPHNSSALGGGAGPGSQADSQAKARQVTGTPSTPSARHSWLA